MVGAGLFTVGAALGGQQWQQACDSAPRPLAAVVSLTSHLATLQPRCLQGLTTCLYPLSVVKTRQMALEGSQSGLKVRPRQLSLPACQRVAGLRRLAAVLHNTTHLLSECDSPCPPAPASTALQGAYITARTVVAHDGLRGLYKGFGTVVLGMFPARMVSAPPCLLLLLLLGGERVAAVPALSGQATG